MFFAYVRWSAVGLGPMRIGWGTTQGWSLETFGHRRVTHMGVDPKAQGACVPTLAGFPTRVGVDRGGLGQKPPPRVLAVALRGGPWGPSAIRWVGSIHVLNIKFSQLNIILHK